MRQGARLGALEELVLLSALRLGRHAHGNRIRQELAALANRAISISTVYVTLMRLEEKGYARRAHGVTWWQGQAPLRGDRRGSRGPRGRTRGARAHVEGRRPGRRPCLIGLRRRGSQPRSSGDDCLMRFVTPSSVILSTSIVVVAGPLVGASAVTYGIGRKPSPSVPGRYDVPRADSMPCGPLASEADEGGATRRF